MRRRAALAAVAGFAAAASVLAVAAPASAATALRVDASCESGASRFTCLGGITGGTAPYSVTWQAVSNATITFSGGLTALGTCTAPRLVQVKVQVTDAVGAYASYVGSTPCSNGPWP